tara:strand:- start:213 stop:779 length:567 start_codon:yes stop_codon:yes gene_type:complete
MPKNIKGGKNAKKQGNKYTVQSGIINKTRFSEDDSEIYACCQKFLGQGNIDIKCIDGKERIGVIRNKFKGRGKRDNIINVGTWLLVGIRDYETIVDGKKQKCDVLEVYNDNDKFKLQQQVTNVDWKIFKGIGDIEGNDNDYTDIGIDITNNDASSDINNTIDSSNNLSKMENAHEDSDEEDEIDIDEI